MNVRQRRIGTMAAVLTASASLLLSPAGAGGPGGGTSRAGAGGGPWSGNGSWSQGGGSVRPGGNGSGQGGHGNGGEYGQHGSDRYGGWGWDAAVPAGVAVVADLPGPYWCGCYTCSEFPPPMAYPGPRIAPAFPSVAMPDVGAPEVAGSNPAVPVIPGSPPAASVQSPPSAIDVWYWCAQPAGYYPYVQSCSQPWQQVLPDIVPPDVAIGR